MIGATFHHAIYVTSDAIDESILTKLATGSTNTSLVEVFGATTDTFISRVYKTTVELLDNKAEGILHGNCLQRWVHLFPDFSEAIRRKLNRPQYGELLFEDVRIVGFLDCKIDETCTPGTGPLNDEELAERRPGAEIIQRALYSGYLKVHGLKVLTVVFPNGIIAYLYGPVSARENDIGLLNLLTDFNKLPRNNPWVTHFQICSNLSDYYICRHVHVVASLICSYIKFRQH